MEQAINAQYNFRIRQAHDAYHITYSKDKFGKGLGCGIFFIVTLLSLAFSSLLSRSFFNALGINGALIIWFIVALGLTILILKLINRIRADKTFVISQNHIGVGNKKYTRKDIQKFYITHPKNGVYRTADTSGGFIIVGKGIGAVAVGAASVASSGGRAASEIMNQAIHKASFKIEFLYGNKKVPLATGLSENNAIVLFDKITELLSQKA
ncbi:MAG: hypothetical protein AAGA02_02305 [Bacteroidota bacterium]